MELRARLTAVNRRVSPDPSGPNAFFMFTQAKAWYVFSARDTARRVLQFGYLVQCPEGAPGLSPGFQPRVAAENHVKHIQSLG
jgi:hypothetical protein